MFFWRKVFFWISVMRYWSKLSKIIGWGFLCNLYSSTSGIRSVNEQLIAKWRERKLFCPRNIHITDEADSYLRNVGNCEIWGLSQWCCWRCGAVSSSDELPTLRRNRARSWISFEMPGTAGPTIPCHIPEGIILHIGIYLPGCTASHQNTAVTCVDVFAIFRNVTKRIFGMIRLQL